MSSFPLGKQVAYPERYDAALLAPIPRSSNRGALGLDGSRLPFTGADVWNAYELSWLDPQGLPQVARARFIFPCTSPCIVESKSLKLYLNSLNQESFSDLDAVRDCLLRDLASASGGEVEVLLQRFSGMQEVLDAPTGDSLDRLDVACSVYEVDAGLLHLADAAAPFEEVVDEVLYTDLFRSLCPITAQPDWATITVCYRGPRIDRAALLRYLVSYRQHQDFHENCVERLWCDIAERCRPQELSVEANFTRRGGLDINPVRSTHEMMDYVLLPRYNRQ